MSNPKELYVRFGFIGALVLVAAHSSTANAEALRWKCAYASMASPKGLVGEKFALEFAFDTVTGSAVIIGNAGMSNVDAFSGSIGITFQEKLASGAIQTTTITLNGSSVHSRHTMMSIDEGKLTPSQYYGRCESVR